MLENRNKSFLVRNVGLVRYGLSAGGLVAFMMLTFHFIVKDSAFFSAYLETYTQCVSALLTIAGEPHKIVISDYRLMTILMGDQDVFLRVGRDASGFYEALMIFGMVVCWPGSLITRLGSGVAAILLMLCLNALRLAVTFLIEVYLPWYSALLGEQVLPVIYIFMGFISFVLWVKLSKRHPQDSAE